MLVHYRYYTGTKYIVFPPSLSHEAVLRISSRNRNTDPGPRRKTIDK
jgi:hypothetical protein